MKITQMKSSKSAAATLATCAALLLSGCTSNFTGAPTVPVFALGPALQGTVLGGRQPIAGATLHLYAAGTTGYAGANTDLLTQAVMTTASGQFDVTGLYSCAPGQQMYLVSLGGNPGAGTNPQAGLMAALGDCASLSATTYINMNEVTTIASAFALSPFMSGYADLGTSVTNTLGLKQAFTSVNKLTSIANGLAGGPALARGGAIPSSKIYSLANILAACVNTSGGAAGDGSVCGNLFTYATPAGGTAPTDTIGLALGIAKNPGLNVTSIFSYDAPTSPYHPTLSSTPNDFTLAVTYTGVGINSPQSVTQDAAGNVWIANAASNTLTALTAAGTPLSGSPFAGNGMNAPAAVAIDLNGNAWAANKGGSTVSGFSVSGAAVGSYTVGSAPSSLAFEAVGNLYVGNSGSNTVSVLDGVGNLTRTINTSGSGPAAIAIAPR